MISGLREFIVLAAFLLPLTSNGEVLFTKEGKIISVSDFSFDGKIGTYTLGDKAVSIDRSEIRDVSFSRQERKEDSLASAPIDSGDLFSQAERTLKTYPDSVVVVLRDEGTFSYLPDDSHLVRVRQAIYVAREEGLGGAGINLSFDPNREKVRLIHAYCIHPDGKAFSVTPEQIAITKGSSGGVYFSDQELLSVTIPNLRVGAIYDYCYEVHTFNPFDSNLFQGFFFFQGTDPVVRSDLSVVIPENKELKVSSQKVTENVEGAQRPTAGDEACEFNTMDGIMSRSPGWARATTSHAEGGRGATGRVPPFIEKLQLNYISFQFPKEKEKPEITRENGNIIYSWSFADMAPIIAETNMPSFREISPFVAFCLLKNWDYMYSKLRPMFEKRFQLTDVVRRKVDEIVAGCTSIEEKMASIYQFCQKEIRYISIKGNLASNQVGHPAAETLKKQLGDCTDKGMLLATMLKHIGVEAYPVGILTNPSGRGVKEIPVFDANHCIVEVHQNGKQFYLDPTATDYRFPYFRADDHDTIADNVMLGKKSQVPLPSPQDNALMLSRKVELFPDGTARIRIETENNGSGEASLRGYTRGIKPEEYEKQMRSIVAGITADYELHLATHSSPLDFSRPFTTTLDYTVRKYASRSGKYMLFAIPKFDMGFPSVALEKRNYDLEYLTTSLREDDIQISIPDGFRVKYLPEALTIDKAGVEFLGEYSREGSGIRIKRRLAITKRRIPVDDYREHKDVLESISKFCEKRIFLEEILTSTGGKP